MPHRKKFLPASVLRHDLPHSRPFLFGATDKLTNLTSHIKDMSPVVILRLRNMTAVDATGLRAMQDVADAERASGRVLL